MIAGLGWSHWAALIGALDGALALGCVFGAVFLFAFLAGRRCARLVARLSRNARAPRCRKHGGNGRAESPLEWYPPGRLVVWAAVLAALVVIVAIPNFGTDAETFRAGHARAALNAVLHPTPARPDSLACPG